MRSILHYNPKGELIKITPGIPGENEEFFFWLFPEKEYLVGGKLAVYTKKGKLAGTYSIPRSRKENILFMKKYKHKRKFVPIAGIDNKKIFIYQSLKKEKPVIIKKVGNALYEILYDIVILKFNIKGEILGVYRIPGPIGIFKMEKEIQVTPDGSIYYWKYFKDRMELWRILPQ